MVASRSSAGFSSSYSNIGKSTHPYRAPGFSTKMLFLVADFHPQRADGVVHHLRLVGAEEHQVAAFRAGALDDRLEGFGRQVLDDRGLKTRPRSNWAASLTLI